jgi:hypothetical protein
MHCFRTLGLTFFHLIFAHFRVPQVLVIKKWWVNHIDDIQVAA